MATNSLQADSAHANPDIASAYFSGALAFEELALSLERLRELAFGLSCSEAFEEAAQHSFYCIGNLARQLQEKTKKLEGEFVGLSEQHR